MTARQTDAALIEAVRRHNAGKPQAALRPWAASAAIYEQLLCDRLEAALAALRDLTRLYLRVADSGDAGNWEPREEPEVIAALAVLGEEP